MVLCHHKPLSTLSAQFDFFFVENSHFFEESVKTYSRFETIMMPMAPGAEQSKIKH